MKTIAIVGDTLIACPSLMCVVEKNVRDSSWNFQECVLQFQWKAGLTTNSSSLDSLKPHTPICTRSTLKSLPAPARHLHHPHISTCTHSTSYRRLQSLHPHIPPSTSSTLTSPTHSNLHVLHPHSARTRSTLTPPTGTHCTHKAKNTKEI